MSSQIRNQGGRSKSVKNWVTGECFAAIEAGLAQSASKSSQTILDLTIGADSRYPAHIDDIMSQGLWGSETDDVPTKEQSIEWRKA